MDEQLYNPSVVTGDNGESNYNISRSKDWLANQDIEFLNQIYKDLKNPSIGNLPPAYYFPSAGKSNIEGYVQNKTVGSVPIFVANAGLLPINLLEAKKKAVQDAHLLQEKLFGSANNQVFNQSLNIILPDVNERFNTQLQKKIDDKFSEYLKKTGNPAVARAALKNDPELLLSINNYKYLESNLNTAITSATKLINDYYTGESYVSKDMYESAVNFISTVNSENAVEKVSEATLKFNKLPALNESAKKASEIITPDIESIVSQAESNSAYDLYSYLQTSNFFGSNIIQNALVNKGVVTSSDLNAAKEEHDRIIEQKANDYMPRYLKESNDEEAKKLWIKMFKDYISYNINLKLQAVRKNTGSYNPFKTENVEPSQYISNVDIIDMKSNGAVAFNTKVVKLDPSLFSKLEVPSNQLIQITDGDGNYYEGTLGGRYELQDGKVYYDPNRKELRVQGKILPTSIITSDETGKVSRQSSFFTSNGNNYVIDKPIDVDLPYEAIKGNITASKPFFSQEVIPLLAKDSSNAFEPKQFNPYSIRLTEDEFIKSYMNYVKSLGKKFDFESAKKDIEEFRSYASKGKINVSKYLSQYFALLNANGYNYQVLPNDWQNKFLRYDVPVSLNYNNKMLNFSNMTQLINYLKSTGNYDNYSDEAIENTILELVKSGYIQYKVGEVLLPNKFNNIDVGNAVQQSYEREKMRFIRYSTINKAIK